MALYYDNTIHTSPDTYWDAIYNREDFWDSRFGDTVTKGGITLTKDGINITMSGYGNTATKAIAASTGLSRTLLACTDTGMIGLTIASVGTNPPTAAWAIGCDDNGNWGGVVGKQTYATIEELIADGVSSINYANGNTSTSDVNTQIINICADKGDFVFKDIKRILQITNPTYIGKIQLDGGEKYVKCGALALAYTV